MDSERQGGVMKTGHWHRAAALIPVMVLSALLLTTPGWASSSEGGGQSGPSSFTPEFPNTTAVDVRVYLENVRFAPREITVAVGNTVTWTHRDSGLSHHVAAHDGSFDSHPTCGRPFGACMKGGDTFSYTFLRAGTYEYHCRLHASSHAGMAGKVTVVD
jgi:plastocyanin